MNRKLMGIGLALALTGCDEESVRQTTLYNTTTTKSSLASDGIVIGTLRDGREVRRYDLLFNKPDRTYTEYHHVYVIDGMATMSDNHRVRHGKSTYDKVEVTAYDGGKLTEAQVLKLAEEVKAKQNDRAKAERAEYDRLKEKYGEGQ